jgi:glutamine amidotransferase
MITIVDYKLGNLGSIRNMLRRIGAPAMITSDREAIARAEKLILPGVGAFGEGMGSIAALGLREVLDDLVLRRRVPVLGICLGMQLMTRRSEEDDVPGLGWIAADTVRFRFPPEQRDLHVPHIGWNTVAIARDDSLFRGLAEDEDTAFYFVHSYHVVCADEADVLARAHHGHDFVAAFQHGHILGTQFHPEKSHRFGMQLLRNFAGFEPAHSPGVAGRAAGGAAGNPAAPNRTRED